MAVERGQLEVRAATHDYSGVVVLRDVDFTITPGSVSGLVGQNGSGKSTLIKILTGVVAPRAGTILLGQEQLTLDSPQTAVARGIAVVHQDGQLFGDLTVAECVLGTSRALPRHRFTRTVDRREMDARVGEALERLGIDVAPTRLVRSLSPAERKFVEIARATLLEPRFLILDEVTAAFEPAAADAVLALVERLRDRGLGICFVSHRLDEVMRVADRITVLRDGRVVGTLDRSDVSEERLIAMIVGGEQERAAALARPTPQHRAPALKLGGTRTAPRAPVLELEVGRGEIVGLVGLLGSGAATLVRMLGGAEPLNGWIEVDGRRAQIHSPRDAARLGIGFIPEDRKSTGLVGDLSVAANISLAALPDVSNRLGVRRRSKFVTLAERYCEAMDIRTRSIYAPVRTLSGGNQQKVMIARCLASGVRFLSIEEPTHGVDVNGRVQIHNLLRRFADDGGALVIATTDVDEALELCDRIVVLRHGKVATSLDPRQLGADAERVLEHLVGTGHAVSGGPMRSRV
ncbi:MAG: sugar ABC transporter ATP-binding protein [Solirubrobacteraceae bacterium]